MIAFINFTGDNTKMALLFENLFELFLHLLSQHLKFGYVCVIVRDIFINSCLNGELDHLNNEGLNDYATSITAANRASLPIARRL